MGWKILGINQWKDPDYRVRLEFAQRSNNQRKLLHLALNDVHELVRVAAVKNLHTDTGLMHVVAHSGCEKSVTLAVGMLQSDEALCEAAAIQDLEVNLRLDAIGRVAGSCDKLLLQLALDGNEKLSLYAIRRCEDTAGLEAIYSEDFTDSRALAIIEKSKAEGFCFRVFETSPILRRRLRALGKIKNSIKLREFYFREHDSAVRASIIDEIDDDQTLIEFFEDEDDESLRIKIVERMSGADFLFSIACEDYNIHVRRAATRTIGEPSKLARIAVNNDDRTIHDIVLGKDLDEEQLIFLVNEASDPYVRVEAINRIKDQAVLEKLVKGSSLPDVVWFCSRSLGRLPISFLRQIGSSEILLRAAEQETQKIARMAAIRQIKEQWALDYLMSSKDDELADAARAMGREIEAPAGLRFLHVPNRIYQLSVFPVTGEQFAQWKENVGDKEAAKKYSKLQDLPVTDVSPEEAKEFCNWLSLKDHAYYRLPYFHEWKHAAVCDDPDWFSTGRLRAFQNQEEAEMVLFGQERSARPLHESMPNPWGFLDTIGNIMEWTCDPVYSEQSLRAGISVDEFAQLEQANDDPLNLQDFAYASGNHWADRRIRSGRWKRLIHRQHLNGSAAGKVGFRVLRFDSKAQVESIEYELTLLPDVAYGYTLDQVCWAVSESLSINYEDAKKRFTVAPYRLAIMRDYSAILRIKESWESLGAQIELASRPVREIANSNA